MRSLLLLGLLGLCYSQEPPLLSAEESPSQSIYNAVRNKYRKSFYENNPNLKPIGKKETICIYTRDGICLSTNIFTPPIELKRPPYNVLYAKTPYGKSSLDADAAVAEALGWVFMGQDCRGRGQSTGDYSFWRTSGNDTMDSMEWYLNQTWSTGNVAAIGVSANALAQYADLIGVTQFPVNSTEFNYYDAIFQHLRLAQLFLGDGMGWHTVYQGGAYRTGLISGWLNGLHEPDMITTVQEHEAFGPWWYPLTGPYNDQWTWINQTVIHFAGFYDIFSTPQIRTALAVNSTARDKEARGQQIVIVDPGGHCPMGEIAWPHDLYGFETIEYWTIPATAAAFDHGSNNNMSEFNIHNYYPFNALWYQHGPGGSGSVGNYWVEASSFAPIIDNPKYYLQSNGGLSTSTQNSVDSTSYLYNPKDPVTTHGGNNLILQPCGPWNQNPVEVGRKDILHFNSSVLTEDIAFLGELYVNLFVESDAVDTDFTVKLIDIHPNGDPYLVQDGIFRMRWRETATWTPDHYQTEPSPPMKKGTIYNITVDLAFMSFIFNKGHQISLSISSSNYKRFSLNYNSGNMVIDGDKGWTTATNTIHFGGQYPSGLILPVVDMQWLEDHRVSQEKIDHVHNTVQDYYKKMGHTQR